MPIRSRYSLALALSPFLLAAGCKQSPPPEQPAQSQPAAAAAPTQIGAQDIVKLERDIDLSLSLLGIEHDKNETLNQKMDKIVKTSKALSKLNLSI